MRVSATCVVQTEPAGQGVVKTPKTKTEKIKNK